MTSLRFRRRLAAFASTLFMLALLSMAMALPAFAQGPAPAPAPTLSTSSAVAMLLSLLFGVVTQMVQTGTFLGQWTTPKTWLPGLTVGATFLGGVVGYVSGLDPFVLTGATIFYAVAAGVAALLAGAAPAIAIHAHVVVPAHLNALRSARTRPGAPPGARGAGGALAVGGALALALLVVACAQAVSAVEPGLVFVECVWTRYQAEPAGTPMPQVILDEVATCGGDAAAVVVALDVKEAPASHAGTAHAK